jgi:hypothetical protein
VCGVWHTKKICGEEDMTPQSFDIDTCKEVIGDARVRVIESKARQDAENGISDPPAQRKNGTYWDGVDSYMEYIVYVTAHHKRTERIARMKERGQA